MPNEWVTYWTAIVGVAGTLLGLAFVTYQVRPSWREERPKYLVAVFNLAEFCVPLFTGLICLMPGHPWRLASAGAGVAGAFLIAIYWKAIRTAGVLDAFDRRQARWSLCSMALALSLIGAAVAGGSDGLRVLGVIQVWLIFSGSAESWALLARTSRRGPEARAGDADPNSVPSAFPGEASS